jgi:NTP pyrophosphatase (non-canonical NTP hydrolase)
MNREQVIDDVFMELRKAEKKHPGWPNSLFEAYTIIAEEVGELAQAILQEKYEKGTKNRIKEEAIQSAAMCLRFLLNLYDK